MKATILAVIKLIGALFMFVGILAGCMAAMLLMLVVIRFPPLLIALLLACWIFSRLKNAYCKASE
ncbi:hypothetical protein [Pseudomonas fragi]|uniref:Lipoprotein n=1 Tax=Pseudomonas fragi TaxID=296 RepID=A0A449IEX2_PSEFR|nr:hypothetical protein [Pseudomonas fragi]VFB17919.1 Uncharacterised protein [Pseudomonas fragi]